MTDATRDLYALDPEDFVAARDALAARLRKDGDAAGAAAVKALRRPTVSVWLLNLLARSMPELVDRAGELGAALREAQDRALGGGDGSALRELAGRRRALVDDVVRGVVAVAAQRDRDVTAATRDAVATAVEASLADEGMLAEWGAGMLREVGEAGGFNFGSAVPIARPPGGPPATARTRHAATTKAGRRTPPADVADDGDRRLREASEKAARLRAEADEAKAEVGRRKAVWADADRAAKLARQLMREAERAASRADLFAATAEQAVWELGERNRR